MPTDVYMNGNDFNCVSIHSLNLVYKYPGMRKVVLSNINEFIIAKNRVGGVKMSVDELIKI